MEPHAIFLLIWFGLLALFLVELLRHRREWSAFLFGFLVLLLCSIATLGAPRINPGGSIIYFTYHGFPTVVLLFVAALFWWKIRKNDYPILSALAVVLSALILTIMIREIIEWAGRPLLRNQLFGL